MENRIQVWFKTADTDYENKLCAFLQYHYAHRMEVHHYSEWSEGGILPKPNAVLLTDGEADSSGFSKVIELTADEIKEKPQEIGMYQSGHKIAKRIIRAVEKNGFEEKEGESGMETEELLSPWGAAAGSFQPHRVWSVYSPTGGVGKTSFAITLSQVLSGAFHRKVLYLNLENVSSYPNYFDRTEYALGDLLYAFLLGRTDSEWEEMLDRVLTEHSTGFYSIAPCVNYEDVMGLTRDEIQRLTQRLSEHFDFIICDFDTSFRGPTEKFLSASDRIFLLWKGNSVSDERRVTFERMIEESAQFNELFERTKVTVGRGNAECYTRFLLPEDQCPVRIDAKDGRLLPDDRKSEYRAAVEEIVKAVMDEK